MSKEEWGTKRICPETGKRFYDLNNSPVISPYTGKEITLDKSSSEKTKVIRKSEENLNDGKFEESEEMLTIEDDLILDIGPNTINLIKNIIEGSETILWNGPAGYFENPNFANGSYEIAKAIIKKNKNQSIYSVVGGGDTVSFLNQINAIEYFNFVSTAGGAFLEYLEGKELPGIKALK